MFIIMIIIAYIYKPFTDYYKKLDQLYRKIYRLCNEFLEVTDGFSLSENTTIHLGHRLQHY